jgi:hypothetical protein
VVVQRVQGGGDDHGARAQGADDVGQRLGRADVAGGRVHDGARARAQGRLGVGGRRDAQAVAEPGQLARVAADLGGVVDEDGGQFQPGMGLDGTDGGAADVAGTPDDRGHHGRSVASAWLSGKGPPTRGFA